MQRPTAFAGGRQVNQTTRLGTAGLRASLQKSDNQSCRPPAATSETGKRWTFCFSVSSSGGCFVSRTDTQKRSGTSTTTISPPRRQVIRLAATVSRNGSKRATLQGCYAGFSIAVRGPKAHSGRPLFPTDCGRDPGKCRRYGHGRSTIRPLRLFCNLVWF